MLWHICAHSLVRFKHKKYLVMVRENIYFYLPVRSWRCNDFLTKNIWVFLLQTRLHGPAMSPQRNPVVSSVQMSKGDCLSSNVSPLPPQSLKGKILTLTQHWRAGVKHETIFIPCPECEVPTLSFVRSTSQTTKVKFIGAALTRCWQMWIQVLQHTCLTK